MLKRCISLVAIAGFIAGQLVAVPCAHSNCPGSAAEQHHAARPHFHLSDRQCNGHADHELPLLSDHGLSDHDSHPHRHDLDLRPRAVAPESPAGFCSPCFDHDADAVYLAAGWHVADSRSKQAEHVATSWADFLAVSTASLAVALEANQLRSVAWRPPEIALDDSTLYLELGHLRL